MAKKGSRNVKAKWPMKSDGGGVHPKQIEEMREKCKRHGVTTDFTPDGRAIFTSRGHRKRYCRLFGMHDKDGGYGDP